MGAKEDGKNHRITPPIDTLCSRYNPEVRTAPGFNWREILERLISPQRHQDTKEKTTIKPKFRDIPEGG